MATSQEAPLVSVLISTWNSADYLKEAIESALAQTYRPIEVVVVDDGSIDHTAQVCASFGDRIRYVHQPKDDRRGAIAFHRAYQESKGAYVAALDHDDRWRPQKVARQMDVMRAQPETGAVFTRFRIIDSAGRDKGESPLVGPSGDVFHVLLTGNRYCHSSGLYPREAVDRVGPHDIETGMGDWDLWLRISRYFPVVMLDEALTEYRVHDQAYSTDLRRMARATRNVLEKERHLMHKHCGHCRRAFRAGIAVSGISYVVDFNTKARRGDMSAAWPSLIDAARTSPLTIFGPRYLPGVVKSLLLLPLRFFGRKRGSEAN